MQKVEKTPYQAPSAEGVEVYRYIPEDFQAAEKKSDGNLYLADPNATICPVRVSESPDGRKAVLADGFSSGIYRIFGGDVPYFCTPSSGCISALCPREQVQEEGILLSDRPGLLWVGTSPVMVGEKEVIPQSIALVPANALLEIPVRNSGAVPLTLRSVRMEQMSGREIPSALSLERDGTISVGIEAALTECFSVRVSLIPPVVIAPENSYVVQMLVAPFEAGPSRFIVNTTEKGDFVFFKGCGMRFLSGHRHRIMGIDIRG